ncbi:MAG: exodeoxyribonuclease VII small subunit [Chloroflexi bacterium]|nr:exodeoxyribonuclease VII small subunit [Chloroflexota bacterium]
MTSPDDAALSRSPSVAAADDGLTFDAALAELERIVAALEAGGAPLETTLELYERAVALESRCSALLAEARLRMERLVERSGGRLETVAIEDRAATEPGA